MIFVRSKRLKTGSLFCFESAHLFRREGKVSEQRWVLQFVWKVLILCTAKCGAERLVQTRNKSCLVGETLRTKSQDPHDVKWSWCHICMTSLIDFFVYEIMPCSILVEANFEVCLKGSNSLCCKMWSWKAWMFWSHYAKGSATCDLEEF